MTYQLTTGAPDGRGLWTAESTPTFVGIMDDADAATALVAAWNAPIGAPTVDLTELEAALAALTTRVTSVENGLITQAQDIASTGADLGTTEDNVSALLARVEDVEAKIPLFITREQTTWNATISAWTAANAPVDRINTANRMTLMTFGQNTRLLSATIAQEYGGIASSDTQYWKFELARLSVATGLATVFATKTTQTTGEFAGGPLEARKPFSFASANWGNADFQSGDMLQLIASPVGYTTVPALRLPMVLSGRAGAL